MGIQPSFPTQCGFLSLELEINSVLPIVKENKGDKKILRASRSTFFGYSDLHNAAMLQAIISPLWYKNSVLQFAVHDVTNHV